MRVKYGWEKYPSLRAEELPDRCWRAEIVVLLWSDTGSDRAIMDKLPRLRLLIAVGDAAAQELCNPITQAIDHYLRSIETLGALP